MKARNFRLISLFLLLTALPITLIDSKGPGWLADSNGWQGYEIVFWWPAVILLNGGWVYLPLAISNAYLVVGMWLRRLPKFLHLAAWFMSIPTILIICIGWGRDLHFSFVILAAAWILSGIGPLFDERQPSLIDT